MPLVRHHNGEACFGKPNQQMSIYYREEVFKYQGTWKVIYYNDVPLQFRWQVATFGNFLGISGFRWDKDVIEFFKLDDTDNLFYFISEDII